ncbi:type II toxin-antitoxin system VapC family toxin [Benzoatithermus flavus]|uniref:Type II toxin-antitoxin system VapC family toxin n=1 Tax=Benzoatithermus flavus TaxID=3108223 RepID=A0ABU8XXT6_9PROT
MSRYLADACALIGFYTAAPGFPSSLRSLLENDTGRVAVAATTVWEIAIKTRLGKLPDIVAPGWPTLTDMLSGQGYVLLPFDPATAEQATRLPPLHADPFDRALVAVAQRTGRMVLTADPLIGRYGVPVRW